MPNKERDLLADLRICEAATPGPWEQMNGNDVFTTRGAVNGEGVKCDDNDGWYIASCNPGPTFVNGEEMELSFHERTANARFIAEAREGWPKAICRAQEAEAKLKAQNVLMNAVSMVVDDLEEKDELTDNERYLLEAWYEYFNTSKQE